MSARRTGWQRYTWPPYIPQPPDADSFGMRADVLVEYDGPQLALFISPSGRARFGSNADRDDAGRERWIMATVSRLEIMAIAMGAPMRDAFAQSRLVELVDFDAYGRPLSTVVIGVGDIPWGPLPVDGAPLPDYARDHLREVYWHATPSPKGGET